MGNQVGVIGGGNLGEQLRAAIASTSAQVVPAVGQTFAPASVSASFNTGGIKRLGANSALAILNCGAVTASGLFAVKVQHSNDDGATDAYADYTFASGWGAVTAAVGGANANQDTVLATDLRGAKLWVRYVWTLSSGTSAIIAQSTILGAFDTLPASAN